MQLHRIDRAKDPSFWSARVGRDVRLIIHKTAQSLLLCYVGHHDAAYEWARRRKIERHPRTGAAQLIEIRETVKEIPRFVEGPSRAPAAAAPLFRAQSDDDLLSLGVPAEWLADVRAATDDTICDLCDHLPPEAGEALLELATGGTPRMLATPGAGVASSSLPATGPSVRVRSIDDGRTIPTGLDQIALSFSHPDAQRRFRVMADAEELDRALEYPWEKWAVFLHPAQREVVERRYGGPARVSGSAGTGKTIVALHRAVYLGKANPGARVLLTTFSRTLARFLRLKLAVLVGADADLARRIDARTLGEVGEQVYASAHGAPKLVDTETLGRVLKEATAKIQTGQSLAFLLGEWSEVVDAWQLRSWEEYRDVTRLGRKTRLSAKQREAMWPVFEAMRTRLRTEGFKTMPEVLAAAAAQVAQNPPYAFAVVDEAQDVTVAQLRFLAALAGKRPDGLFFTGDLGQQIFQSPFSWRSLGVDIRGRSHTLRVNYRTSHQIRRQADRLLPSEIADVDGNSELRRGTVSVFNGPEPEIKTSKTADEETTVAAAWLRDRLAGGLRPEEIGIFVRSAAQLDRARGIARAAGLAIADLDAGEEPTVGRVSISTMHLAKGLEFRAVAVAALDEGVVPLAERLEGVTDHADLEQVFNSERHLLYVACTRARDHLLVSGVDPVSEFLDDLRPSRKA
jgi:UvrD-like helicase C-terminal domain/UvrD/REP helicase N-terminal domain